MAKSKKKARTRPGGAQATATKQPAMPAVAPATPGGPNRIARKEEARRQREVVRRRMAHRRQFRVIGLALALLLVAGGITAYVVTRPSAASAAGCGSVQVTSSYPGGNDRTHITAGGTVSSPPPLSTYPTTPPASGPHDPAPLGSGVYTQPPGIYHTIHSLEHAAVIIWYRPGTQSAQLTAIQTYYSDPLNNDHVIVAPYNYPDQGTAGTLPSGKQMVLVAWHHVEDCARINLAAAKDFVKHYRLLTGQSSGGLDYRGNAPEPGLAI